MAQDDHTRYNPSAGAHVLKDFTFNGHDFLAGEPFPVEEVLDEKVRMLWNNGLVSFGKPSKQLVASLSRRAADVKKRDTKAAARAKARADKAKASTEKEAPARA